MKVLLSLNIYCIKCNCKLSQYMRMQKRISLAYIASHTVTLSQYLVPKDSKSLPSPKFRKFWERQNIFDANVANPSPKPCIKYLPLVFGSMKVGLKCNITAGTLVPSTVNGDIAIQWEWSNFDPLTESKPRNRLR